jgi:4-aminobutyrate aminotransferase-like enzyme
VRGRGLLLGVEIVQDSSSEDSGAGAWRRDFTPLHDAR